MGVPGSPQSTAKGMTQDTNDEGIVYHTEHTDMFCLLLLRQTALFIHQHVIRRYKCSTKIAQASSQLTIALRHTPVSTYRYTEVHCHSTVHWTGRFYCLIPVVCSLHHRCRSLQSCRLYWREYVDHLWGYQYHHSR